MAGHRSPSNRRRARADMIKLAAGSALLALAIAAVRVVTVLRADEGTARMQGIAAAIREGAAAFLRRELSVVAIVAALIAIAIALTFGSSGIALAGGFVLGAAGSALASVFGVLVSVRANVRTAAVASHASVQQTLRFAFGAGTVIASGSWASPRSSSSAATCCSAATCRRWRVCSSVRRC
jgi:K(+)-stimulated pyrophosphate-energized sodium pump